MDVAIELDADGADIVIEAGDLRADRGLRTAVLVSLFCDARARADEVASGADARGWWAESIGEQWGSKLWLLARAKRTQEVLEHAKQHARDALAWATQADVAQIVNTSASYGPAGELGIDAQLARGRSRRWPLLWSGEEAREVEIGGVRLRLLPG